MAEDGTVSEATLQEVVRRVASAARPERILFFGSAARREKGPNSDSDLLIIKGVAFDQSRLAGDILAGFRPSF